MKLPRLKGERRMKDKRILPVLTDEEMGKKVLLEVLKQHIIG